LIDLSLSVQRDRNVDPYDQLPYQSLPIEWTAPERLALASLLHGGPRAHLRDYQVLELGCANGANLLPLAYYRPNAHFLGVDGARSAIDLARARRADLGLTNIDFIHSDFISAGNRLNGPFDFIIAHGVFSWVPNEVRDALFELCAQCLRPGGLVYLNYNARPGWNVRGMIRDFLLAQTREARDLGKRAEHAQEVAAKIVASFQTIEHPFSQLIANEFRFVCENHASYIAHEYLATDNHAYWRSEFLKLARSYGLEYVADADFNYAAGRVSEDLPRRLDEEQIVGRSVDDTVDLLCYRQLHSPILTPAPWTRHPASSDEIGSLWVASCLTPLSEGDRMFHHAPSGTKVEAKEEIMRSALERLAPLWPRGLRVASLFPDLRLVADDLKLLQRNGLIELRLFEPNDLTPAPEPLNQLESKWGAYATTVYHTRETVSTTSCAANGS
jgi:SAM-dependent methyltransferase